MYCRVVKKAPTGYQAQIASANLSNPVIAVRRGLRWRTTKYRQSNFFPAINISKWTIQRAMSINWSILVCYLKRWVTVHFHVYAICLLFLFYISVMQYKTHQHRHQRAVRIVKRVMVPRASTASTNLWTKVDRARAHSLRPKWAYFRGATRCVYFFVVVG